MKCILYTFQIISGGSLNLKYRILNTSTWSLTSGGINLNPAGTNWRMTNSPNGSLAIGKPLANGNHWMYAVTNDAVYKYEITNNGIIEASTGNYIPYIGAGATNQIIPYRAGVGQTTEYFIGSHNSAANEIDTRAYEAELSHDGTRLAWGSRDSGKVAFIKLN
jgi:hypothetical protein